MTDPKKNPKKIRRSFFWQRKPCLPPDLTKPTIAAEAPQREGQPWYHPSLLKVAIVVLAVLAILPTRANGQFGIDTAAILAALSKMQSLMNTFIATPLRTINQYEQSVAKYEQEVMYPLVAINQAKSSVMQFENQFNQVSGMFRVNVSSATLPQSQNLEVPAALAQRCKCANRIRPVSKRLRRCYGTECGIPTDENDDRHDRCAGPGRDEASDRDRCLGGCGVERSESDGPADLAGCSWQRSDPRSRGRRVGCARQCIHSGGPGRVDADPRHRSCQSEQNVQARGIRQHKQQQPH